MPDQDINPAPSAEILRTDAPARVTNVSQNFIDLVVHFECSGNINNFLKAYKDSVGIPTIGIGTTFYPGGARVQMGDTCTVDQAYTYFRHEVANVMSKVDSYTRDDISQGMFDALVDFGYNLGTGALRGSTLLKVVNANPVNYAAIQTEFQKWCKAKDPKTGQLQTLSGLLRRRNCEFYLYKNGTNAPGFME